MAMSAPTLSSGSVPKTGLKKSDYKAIKAANPDVASSLNASNLAKYGSTGTSTAAAAAALANQTGGNIMGFTYE